jgi:Na+-transporting NADH:ubiquinone oxidoreductase subunit C
MKSFSNTYIFIFSTVMVTIVAALLAFVSEQLRPTQEKNVEIEKKLDILRSVRRAADAGTVDNKDIYVEKEYDEYITGSFVLDQAGNTREGIDAFTVNVRFELSKPPEERNLPVFIYTAQDSAQKFIFPMWGKGLWGPIWGYVSLNEDFTTIYGAIFAHAKETPGLGAEINTKKFQDQFIDKVIFDTQGQFISVQVVRGGAPPGDPSAVDAISGGTITSKALQKMMFQCLGNYEVYLKSKRLQP